jgi:hypothetical protein
MRVAAIDYDIAWLSASLQEGLDERIDSWAGLDENHHTPRLLELLDEFFCAPRANDALALGFVLQEAVDFGDGTVEGYDGEAVIGGVEDQVLAHDSQTDEAEVAAVDGALSAMLLCQSMRLISV